jgi:predicted CopG family antitoxin
MRRQDRTTIVLTQDVRKELKHIARKDQSYNDLIIDLIRLHGDQLKLLGEEESTK